MTLEPDSWSRDMEAALDCIRRERDEVECECRAMQRFRQRIQRLDTHTPQIEQPTFGTQQRLSPSRRLVRDRIESCYRETVMAVNHYDDVYGDSFEESVSIEFGTEIARQISEATSFSPIFQQHLLDATQRCITNRRIYVETLQDERTALKDAQSTVRKIRQMVLKINDEQLQCLSGTQLTTQYETLHSMRQECEGWLQSRQQQLHARLSKESPVADANTGLCPYLYASLDVTYPILSTFVAIHNQIYARKQQIVRSFTN